MSRGPKDQKKRFNIVTTGAGMLPRGRIVGFIEADSTEEAKLKLIESGQIGKDWPLKFDYEEILE